MRELLKIYTDFFDANGYPSLDTLNPPTNYEIVYQENVPIVVLPGLKTRFITVPVLHMVVRKKENGRYSAKFQMRIKFYSEPFDDLTYFDDNTGFVWSLDSQVTYESVNFEFPLKEFDPYLKGIFLVTKDKIFKTQQDFLIHMDEVECSLEEGEDPEYFYQDYAPGYWGIVANSEDITWNFVPHNERNSVVLREICRMSDSVFGYYDYMGDVLNASRSLLNVPNKEIAFVREMLGLDLGTDVIEYDRERLLAIELPKFWEANGTKKFLDLMRLATNIEFSISPLWTEDYKVFVRQEDLPVFSETFYPTSRVALSYSLENTNVFKKDVESIFYTLAPAELVLWEVSGIGKELGSLYFIPASTYIFIDKAKYILTSYTTYFYLGLTLVYGEPNVYYTNVPKNNHDPALCRSITNFVAYFKVYFESPSSALAFSWRQDPKQRTGYHLEINASGSLYLMGSTTRIGSANVSISLYEVYSVKISVSGSQHRVKFWLDGTTEPSSWTMTVNDASFSSGIIGISTKDVTWVEIHYITQEF